MNFEFCSVALFGFGLAISLALVSRPNWIEIT